MNIPINGLAYNNLVLTITNRTCPDPYVIHAHGKFYMTYTAGNRVEIWCSNSLLKFEETCEKHKVWQPPGGRVFSGDIWAPELHALQGRWYIYVACDDPKHGNKSHRMYVLGGPPASEDPSKHQFKIIGPIRNLPDQWAIDGTVIHLMGAMYMVYSSWPIDSGAKKRYGDGKNVQELHIVKLGAPDEAVSEPTLICWPDQKWEWSGNAGINEGPQWLAAPDGSWVGIAYSCAGSWTRDYKMNTIQFVGHDPLDPKAWRKSREPLLQSLDKAPFGPGHGSFIEMQGDFIGIFHGTDNATDGWGNRKARCQRVNWTNQGPHMGKFCGPITTDLDVFRGIKQPPGHYNHHGGIEGFLHKASEKLGQKIREL